MVILENLVGTDGEVKTLMCTTYQDLQIDLVMDHLWHKNKM